MFLRCQCLTQHGQGPQCSREVSHGQHYCNQHARMKTHQQTGSSHQVTEEPKIGLMDVTDENIADQICRELDRNYDYRGLIALAKQNVLFHKTCQPYLKRYRLAEQRIVNQDIIGLGVKTKDGTSFLLDISKPIPEETDPKSLQKLILPHSKVYHLMTKMERYDILDSFDVQGPATIQDLYEASRNIFFGNSEIEEIFLDEPESTLRYLKVLESRRTLFLGFMDDFDHDNWIRVNRGDFEYYTH